MIWLLALPPNDLWFTALDLLGEDEQMVRNRDKSRSWSLVYGPSQDGTRAALELDQEGKGFLLC